MIIREQQKSMMFAFQLLLFLGVWKHGWSNWKWSKFQSLWSPTWPSAPYHVPHIPNLSTSFLSHKYLMVKTQNWIKIVTFWENMKLLWEMYGPFRVYVHKEYILFSTSFASCNQSNFTSQFSTSSTDTTLMNLVFHFTDITITGAVQQTEFLVIIITNGVYNNSLHKTEIVSKSNSNFPNCSLISSDHSVMYRAFSYKHIPHLLILLQVSKRKFD